MVGVSGMTNWEWLEDDEEIDKSGEPEEIVSARVEWKNAWKKLQQTKRQWTEENSRLDRKQKLKLLDKLETDASYAEYALIEYYAYYAARTPENIEERENIKQGIIAELYYKEGFKDGIDFIIKHMKKL